MSTAATRDADRRRQSPRSHRRARNRPVVARPKRRPRGHGERSRRLSAFGQPQPTLDEKNRLTVGMNGVAPARILDDAVGRTAGTSDCPQGATGREIDRRSIRSPAGVAGRGLTAGNLHRVRRFDGPGEDLLHTIDGGEIDETLAIGRPRGRRLPDIFRRNRREPIRRQVRGILSERWRPKHQRAGREHRAGDEAGRHRHGRLPSPSRGGLDRRLDMRSRGARRPAFPDLFELPIEIPRGLAAGRRGGLRSHGGW
jgi:hypothetical protein